MLGGVGVGRWRQGRGGDEAGAGWMRAGEEVEGWRVGGGGRRARSGPCGCGAHHRGWGQLIVVGDEEGDDEGAQRAEALVPLERLHVHHVARVPVRHLVVVAHHPPPPSDAGERWRSGRLFRSQLKQCARSDRGS